MTSLKERFRGRAIVLDRLRQELRAQRYGKAIGACLLHWDDTQAWLQRLPAAERPAAFRKACGPLLAELFQPQDERPWSCGLLQGLRTHIDQVSPYLKQLTDEATGLPALVRLRAATIQLVRTDQVRPDRIRGRLAQLLEGYRTLWNTACWSELHSPALTPPAAWTALKHHCPHVADHLATLVSADANPCGWRDPAVAFLAESLLECWGQRIPADGGPGAALCGRTWILIADDDPLRTVPQPTGLLLDLQVERIPGGGGAFYPHPDHAAHVQLGPAFQQALRNAWQVILGHTTDAAILGCDYRWRLAVVDDSHNAVVPPEERDQAEQVVDVIWHRRRHRLCFDPLNGRSGEIALAAALRSAALKQPLDRTRAASGQFSEALPTTANPLVSPVTSLDAKGRGLDEAGEALQRASGLTPIEVLVLPTGTTPPLTGHRSPEFVTHFEAAWEALSADSQLTQRYHQACLSSTRNWFKEHCFAKDDNHPRGSYVLNRLGSSSGDLSDQDAALLTTGQVVAALASHEEQAGKRPTPPRRLVKIVADSGIGKTSFLVYCEHQTSAAAGAIIPLRIEHLGPFLDAGTTHEAILAAALTEVQAIIALSAVETVTGDQLKSWLARKAVRGEIAWLLDALDQMSTHRDRIASLTTAFPKCSVILTMRPEAEQDAGSLITSTHGGDWDRLDLRPFSEDDARAYLGEEYAELFFQHLPLQDSRQDKDGHVLTIPLLLHLLKDLACRSQLDPGAKSINLPEFRNRYAVYVAVLLDQKRGLLAKGYDSLRHREPDLQGTFEELGDALACVQDLAWQQARQHHIDTAVREPLYSRIKQSLRTHYGKKTLSAVKQLNLLTLLPTFDESPDGGLKWRHRSFFEFLAGCQLANLFADPATQADAVQVLYSVQSVLEANGAFRRDLLNTDGETCRNLPKEWDWTLRFALGHAVTLGVQDALAWQLIVFGNPWVVYRAIEQDRLTFDADLEMVCRWLVHRDYPTTEAWKLPVDQPPVMAWRHCLQRPCRVGAQAEVAETIAARVSGLLSRATRDTVSMSPLLELLTATTQTPATASGVENEIHAACVAALTAYHSERSQALTATERAVLDIMESRFIPIPAGTFDPRPFHDAKELSDAGVTGPIRIPAGLSLGDFPVTNAELEAWCPTRRRLRNTVSHADDQPAVYVPWWAATAYAAWLTGTRTDGAYELPSEWFWEWACRGADPHRAQFAATFWWGQAERTDLCWCSESTHSDQRRTRGRSAAVAIMEQVATTEGVTHPSHEWALSAGQSRSVGLLDLHGNVLEWCHSRYQMNTAGPVLRGGSWYDNARGCRSAYRNAYGPGSRNGRVGLRLCWRLRSFSLGLSSS